MIEQASASRVTAVTLGIAIWLAAGPAYPQWTFSRVETDGCGERPGATLSISPQGASDGIAYQGAQSLFGTGTKAICLTENGTVSTLIDESDAVPDDETGTQSFSDFALFGLGFNGTEIAFSGFLDPAFQFAYFTGPALGELSAIAGPDATPASPRNADDIAVDRAGGTANVASI